VRRGASALLAASLLAAGAARAQEGGDGPKASPRLQIELRRDSAGAIVPPVVRALHLMSDGAFEGSLRNGFPVRFTFHLALWRDAFLYDRPAGELSWEAVVILDPVTSTYQLIRSPDSTVTNIPDVRSLDSALATPFTVDVVPPRRGGRYYYIVDLDAESLPLSELEEMERWLRGDLGRAITRRGDVNNAFSRGARLIMIRLSGLPRRSLLARTSKFQP
jgi:hypothetical protein